MSTIDHVGLSVPNIDKAIKWYTATFDIFQISKIIEVNCEKDPITKDIFDNVCKKFKIVHMCTSDGIGVELFQFINPKNEMPSNNFEFWKTSITHIAFTTKNIEEVYDKIKSTGGKHKSKIWNLFENKPYKVCYCEDPWGNIIELSSHPYSVIWSNYSKPHLDQKNKL